METMQNASGVTPSTVDSTASVWFCIQNLKGHRGDGELKELTAFDSNITNWKHSNNLTFKALVWYYDLKVRSLPCFSVWERSNKVGIWMWENECGKITLTFLSKGVQAQWGFLPSLSLSSRPFLFPSYAPFPPSLSSSFFPFPHSLPLFLLSFSFTNLLFVIFRQAFNFFMSSTKKFPLFETYST